MTRTTLTGWVRITEPLNIWGWKGSGKIIHSGNFKEQFRQASVKICWAYLILGFGMSWWPSPSSISYILVKWRKGKQWSFPALQLRSRTSFCSVFVLCLAQGAPSPLLLSSVVHKFKFQADDTLPWFSLFFYSNSPYLYVLPHNRVVLLPYHISLLGCFIHISLPFRCLHLWIIKSPTRRFVESSQYSQATVLIRIFKGYHIFYACYYY